MALINRSEGACLFLLLGGNTASRGVANGASPSKIPVIVFVIVLRMCMRSYSCVCVSLLCAWMPTYVLQFSSEMSPKRPPTEISVVNLWCYWEVV